MSLSALDTDSVASQIRRCGARATPARIRVLQLLRSTPGALSHNQIEQALGDRTAARQLANQLQKRFPDSKEWARVANGGVL